MRFLKHFGRPATSSMDSASSTSMTACRNGRGTRTPRARSTVDASPFLDPRSQHDFERPRGPMLAMELQIRFRDVVRVGHVVVDGHSREPVRAGAVLLSPADRGVDRHIGYVD